MDSTGAAAPGSFVVVGDEDQPIYAFKYAHPEGASFDRDVGDGSSVP